MRALQALEAARPELRERWAGAVERLLKDASAEVRAAAVHALAAIRGERAAELMRRYLDDHDPRVVTTAAATLAGSARDEDVAAAEAALDRLAADIRETAVDGRRQVAAALGRDRRRPLPLAPRSPDVRPGPRGRARGDPQRRAGRRAGGPPRAAARVAPPPPIAPRRGAGRARRPRRGSRGGARALPGGGGGGRGGAAPDPGDTRPHPVAEVGGSPAGEPRAGGRDPPRPGPRRSRETAARASRPRLRAGRRSKSGPSRRRDRRSAT